MISVHSNSFSTLKFPICWDSTWQVVNNWENHHSSCYEFCWNTIQSTIHQSIFLLCLSLSSYSLVLWFFNSEPVLTTGLSQCSQFTFYRILKTSTSRFSKLFYFSKLLTTCSICFLLFYINMKKIAWINMQEVFMRYLKLTLIH